MGISNAATWLNRGRETAVLTAVILATCGPAVAQCRDDQVELRGPNGTARFTVEVADDDAERSRGLMFRDSMARSAGMLFIYDTPRRASFWMRNTLIPLDMIFADATGRVTRVHSNAIPRDETPIDGGTDVLYVLEINGGLAKRLGIAEGADLRHPAIDAGLAVWPCESAP